MMDLRRKLVSEGGKDATSEVAEGLVEDESEELTERGRTTRSSYRRLGGDPPI